MYHVTLLCLEEIGWASLRKTSEYSSRIAFQGLRTLERIDAIKDRTDIFENFAGKEKGSIVILQHHDICVEIQTILLHSSCFFFSRRIESHA